MVDGVSGDGAARERLWPLLARHVTAALYRRTRRFRAHRELVGAHNVLPTPTLAERLAWWLAQRLPDWLVVWLGARRLLQAAQASNARARAGRRCALPAAPVERRPRAFSADFRSLATVVKRLAAGKRVVAFDVFDTVLRRRMHPERVKDLTARRLAERVGNADGWREMRSLRARIETELGRESEARGQDHEFRLREMLERWAALASDATAQAASGRGAAPGAQVLAADLAQAELDFERCATLPTPGIEPVLGALRALGARLIFVSDMYLSAADVRALLDGHGLGRYFAAGYVSSDLGLTKRSGRLYEEVLRREGLSAGELLVVGDNPYSDFDAPTAMGISAVHLRDTGELARRTRMIVLDELAARNPYWVGALEQVRSDLADARPPHTLIRAAGPSAESAPPVDNGPHYELGRTLAPAFYAFSQYILEQSRALELDRLLFFSREGLTFMRLARRIARAARHAYTLPPAAYAAVSRRATFLPSMARLDWPETERMWRQYDRQSLRQLLHNLSLPAEEFLPLAARAGWIDADAPLENPASFEPLYRFLADERVQERFAQHRDRARRRMLAHLRARGLFGGRRVGVVDIGWRGSIQDNLVRALDGEAGRPEIHGLYLGLTGVGDALPGSHKHAFLADARRGDWLEEVVFKNGPVFEMFSTAPHGAVEGYEEAPRRRGGVRPRVLARESERRNLAGPFRQVFRGMECAFRERLGVAPLSSAGSAQLRPWIVDQLRRYVLYPTRREARAFLEYSHAESFGVQHVTTYEFKGSWRRILAGRPWRIHKRLITTLQRQFWPEAILRRTGLPLATFAYDLLETRYAARRVPPTPVEAAAGAAWVAAALDRTRRAGGGSAAGARGFRPPRVAIVIPCYNHGHYLPEAVASARSQTYEHTECVVVDDGSTDAATLAALARLERDGVRVIRQANHGLAAARNAGVRAADCEFFVPLDADDRIEPRFVAELLLPLLRHARLGYAYCHAELFGAEQRVWPCPDYDPRRLVLENLSTATALVRREAFERVGGYRPEMSAGYEDWDFWLALLDAGYEGRLVPLPLFRYRKHAGGASMLARLAPRRDAMVLEMIRGHRRRFEAALWPRSRSDRPDEHELLRQWHAARAARQLEEARSWRLLGLRSAPGRRLILGRSPDAAARLTPVERLALLEASAPYRLLRSLKRTALLRWYARRRYGAELVEQQAGSAAGPA
ncbi:MAG: glycosyltransferase [Phycisphaerae bacterium]|nr:glycosyltransferase [Phycisphaerae bacterium]MCZ2399146.1 glycosyltransferase [Phycisphaerae bacterium]